MYFTRLGKPIRGLVVVKLTHYPRVVRSTLHQERKLLDSFQGVPAVADLCPQRGSHCKRMKNWCPGWEANPHEEKSPEDFKCWAPFCNISLQVNALSLILQELVKNRLCPSAPFEPV